MHWHAFRGSVYAKCSAMREIRRATTNGNHDSRSRHAEGSICARQMGRITSAGKSGIGCSGLFRQTSKRCPASMGIRQQEPNSAHRHTGICRMSAWSMNMMSARSWRPFLMLPPSSRVKITGPILRSRSSSALACVSPGIAHMGNFALDLLHMPTDQHACRSRRSGC